MSDGQKLFSHMVYFSLRDRSSEVCQQLVEECRCFLSSHPGTVFFAAGTLADTHRNVNDRDFDVALHVVFENQAAHDQYQTADRHQLFVERNRANWERVRVFDADVIK